MDGGRLQLRLDWQDICESGTFKHLMQRSNSDGINGGDVKRFGVAVGSYWLAKEAEWWCLMACMTSAKHTTRHHHGQLIARRIVDEDIEVGGWVVLIRQSRASKHI
jgi:hypothetical protein